MGGLLLLLLAGAASLLPLASPFSSFAPSFLSPRRGALPNHAKASPHRSPALPRPHGAHPSWIAAAPAGGVAEPAAALGQLEAIVRLANETSALGWQHSQDDATNARDRDGTWVTRDDTMISKLKEAINASAPRMRGWAWLRQSPTPFFIPVTATPGAQVRIHFIPSGQTLPPLEHPTGSVVLSKALFGKCDVRQMLGNPRGKAPMRETVRSLIGSEEVKLFLGGPCRVYGEATMEGPCAVLEVCLIPMMKITNMNGFLGPDDGSLNGGAHVTEMTFGKADLSDLVTEKRLAALEEATFIAEETEEKESGEVDGQSEIAEMTLSHMRRYVGGLDDQLATIIRRSFASRKIPPSVMSELGLRHVRGILMYGPPGCGKTLIAREISRALKSRPPKIVNGPEILDKWVGEAERNVRALFFDAESEWVERGAESGLHVVILDEMDAFAKRRGTLSGDSSGVRDSVVNQLLAIMDGVREMDNFLVIGLTNRKDLIDPALLRPGRLEVHLEIKAPSAQGRQEILEIHMRRLRNSGRLEEGVWAALPDIAAKRTEGYTGAELAGVVRSATSFALERTLDKEEELEGSGRSVQVTMDDMSRALKEVRPMSAPHSGLLSRLKRAVRGG